MDVEPPLRCGPRPRQRRWIGLVLLAAVLLGVGTYSFVDQQMQRADAALRQDILSSHRVIRLAADRHDADLFASLVAKDDSPWAQAQQELVRRGLLFDLRFLGLQRQADDSSHLAVNVSPDRQQAVVVFEQAYAATGQDASATAVRLRHSAYYRFDGSRWQLASPDAAFWGRSVRIVGRRLTLIAPQRDEEIARRLSLDLDVLLDRLCSGQLCPADLHLVVTLSAQPSALLDLARSIPLPLSDGPLWSPDEGWLEFGRYALVLPAPTLFGVPVDEAGFRILERAYAVRLARAVLAASISSTADPQLQFVPAAIDRQLAQLDLLPWPPAADSSESAVLVPPPAQDIQAICVQDWQLDSDLVRYAPADATWRAELVDRPFASMFPLPDDSGVLLQEQPSRGGLTWSRLFVWRNQIALDVFERPVRPAFNAQLDWANPPAQRLLPVVYLQRWAAPNGRPVAHGLLDLESCTATYCEVKNLAASVYPVWSPDGSRTIIQWPADAPDARQSGEHLFRGSADGLPLEYIGNGFSPFWLDSETYGYIAAASDGRTQLVTASVSDAQPRQLGWSRVLRQSLPARAQSKPLAIWRVVVDPVTPAHVLVEASTSNDEGDSYVFLLNRRSNSATVLPIASRAGQVAFSRDGRWVAVARADPTSATWMLYLYDIDHDQVRSLAFDLPYALDPDLLPRLDWSADGRWLVVLNGGILHLIAPAYDIHRAIVPPWPGCAGAAWIDR